MFLSVNAIAKYCSTARSRLIVPRAAASCLKSGQPDCWISIKRNYVSGCFSARALSQSPDVHHVATDSRASLLREEHQFRGYIHLKTFLRRSRRVNRGGRAFTLIASVE